MTTAKMTYLVCINDKPHAKTAIRFACSRAKKTKSDVLMLYVIDPVDYNTMFSVADVIKQERIEQAEKTLAAHVEDAQKWCKITPKYTIREGFISDEIVKCIGEDNGIGLLVLGVAADGSSGKNKLLAQMVEGIGAAFHVPLLIVPGNLTDQQIKELS